MTPRTTPDRLGIQKDQVVQELGWDDDVDDDIRADIEDACGGELLDEDADEVIDVVLLWWRDDDGDLVDRLMDAITPLADDGVIWVVTPKTGKPGHVHARRDRRVGADGRADADVVGQPRRLERQPAGAAEVQGGGAALTMLDVGSRGARLHAQGPERPAGHAERLPRRQERAAGVLPARVHRHLPGRARRDPRPPARPTRTTTPPRWRSRWGRRRPTRSGRRRAASLFPVLSDFWPHGAVAQAYGVFNDDAGFANRGTFVVDRSGIIRFAEMKQPGEARDQAVWTDALDGAEVGLTDFRVARHRRVACPATGA